MPYQCGTRALRARRFYVSKGEMLPVNLGHLELHLMHDDLMFRRAAAPAGRPSTVLVRYTQCRGLCPIEQNATSTVGTCNGAPFGMDRVRVHRLVAGVCGRASWGHGDLRG